MPFQPGKAAPATEPCPTCPRQMRGGSDMCGNCRSSIKHRGRVSKPMLPCPTCQGRMQHGHTACSKCRVNPSRTGVKGPRETKGDARDRRYPPRRGVELEALEPTPDEEKRLREARVKAYMAMIDEQGKGVIDYQAGIRLAAAG